MRESFILSEKIYGDDGMNGKYVNPEDNFGLLKCKQEIFRLKKKHQGKPSMKAEQNEIKDREMQSIYYLLLKGLHVPGTNNMTTLTFFFILLQSFCGEFWVIPTPKH